MGKRFEETAEFLKRVLSAGPLSSQQAWEQAQQAGYSRRTYDRARKALPVQATRRGWGSRGMWEVSLTPANLQFLAQGTESERSNMTRLEQYADQRFPVNSKVS